MVSDGKKYCGWSKYCKNHIRLACRSQQHSATTMHNDANPNLFRNTEVDGRVRCLFCMSWTVITIFIMQAVYVIATFDPDLMMQELEEANSGGTGARMRFSEDAVTYGTVAAVACILLFALSLPCCLYMGVTSHDSSTWLHVFCAMTGVCGLCSVVAAIQSFMVILQVLKVIQFTDSVWVGFVISIITALLFFLLASSSNNLRKYKNAILLDMDDMEGARGFHQRL